MMFNLTDSTEVNRAKVTVETPSGSLKMRANQIPVIGPEDDLTGMLLQVGMYLCLEMDDTLIPV